jgi:hypothetical protein
VTRARGCFAAIVSVVLLVAIALAGWTLFTRRPGDFSTEPMVVGFREMNQLTVFAAQVVAVPTTTERGILFSQSQTDIYPANVRYTIDLSKLTSKNVSWNPASHVLTLVVPPVMTEAAELDVTRKRTFRTGGHFPGATWDQFDRSNAVKAKSQSAELARKSALMHMAEASGRNAVAKTAELFVRGALPRADNVKVIVRFVTEGQTTSERWDQSRKVLADPR